MKKLTVFLCLMLMTLTVTLASNKVVYYAGPQKNDLLSLLRDLKFNVKTYPSWENALRQAPKGAAVFLLPQRYPDVASSGSLSLGMLQEIHKKNLKVYLEYPKAFPGLSIKDQALATTLERAVITSPAIGRGLEPLSLISINNCHILETDAANPLVVLSKVVGFNKAEYGLNGTPVYPLLFEKDQVLISTTGLSDFRTGRYGPHDHVSAVISYIIGWAIKDGTLAIKSLPSDVNPMYGRTEKLKADARKNAIKKGVEWFYKGRFFVDQSWKSEWLNYQGNGAAPVGPPVPQSRKNGDGSLGILEGHASNIYSDGTSQYRYWMRADVQGESAMALSAAGNLLNIPSYKKQAENLIDYMFHGSNMWYSTDQDSVPLAKGLLGWSVTHPHVFYGDDNARAILGVIATSAALGKSKWNREIVENILANLRTSGKNGFRGERLEAKDITKNGLAFYQERDLINPHPHFEAWEWACYLWLYNQTGYEPLLKAAKDGIRMTMEHYPDRWNWTNGIQQERARMILPLAWLVRIEDTNQHRKWLDDVVTRVLENQDASGAIREELGDGATGMFGTTKSNDQYGLTEAPLIFKNGDPVADMLYTSNFAIFGLNEAAKATGETKYVEAVNKLSDFLTRIQVSSKKHQDVDGAWFRAFDYNRWEYWGSNADAGWGVWSTLTDWIQNWIVATQSDIENKTSYWELTQDLQVKKEFEEAKSKLLSVN